MTVVEKLERALVLSKELGFTDQQVKELVSLILDLPITKMYPLPGPQMQPPPWIQPLTPWQPYTTGPFIGDGTTITCYGTITNPNYGTISCPATFGIIGHGPLPSGDSGPIFNIR